MKVDDLVKPCLNYAEASIMDPRKPQFRFGFVMGPSDIGIVLNPMDWGGYVKAIMRGTIVWVSENAVEVLDEGG